MAGQTGEAGRPGDAFTFIRLLLVEDNPGDAMLVEERLGEARSVRFSVQRAKRLGQAVEVLRSEPFDLVLLDLGLPDSHGTDTLARLQEAAPRVPVVILTGYEDEAMALKALRMGAQDYLVKGPIDAQLLCRSILYAIERGQILHRLKESEDRFRKVLDEMDDAVMVLDDEGTVQFVNPAAQTMFGPRGEDLVGMHLDLPEVEGETAELAVVDDRGRQAVARAHVRDIQWEGRRSYLLTVADADGAIRRAALRPRDAPADAPPAGPAAPDGQGP